MAITLGEAERRKEEAAERERLTREQKKLREARARRASAAKKPASKSAFPLAPFSESAQARPDAAAPTPDRTEGDPRAELAARELCRRRLLAFIRRFRPKYIAGWVHEDICRRIERFVRQVEEGKSPRLLLLCPPRSGKSEISSRHTAAWALGKHPDWEIIAASHTASLSMSFSRYLRDLMRDPAYQTVFPDASLDPSTQSVENWLTTAGGGYVAAGIGTGITGRGAHILLIDDVVKDQEAADSQTIRDATWEWYLSTAYTRLAPGGGVLAVMTWWHEDDWAGRVLGAMREGEGDVFEVVRYPALNEEGDEYILADDAIVQIDPATPPPKGARMTRPRGTALHPERYSTEALQKIRANLIGGGLKRVWDALYQQNPTPDEGVHFRREWMQSAPERLTPITPSLSARHGISVYQAWDFAISERQTADYTVGVCVAQDSSDNLTVLDMRRFQMGDGIGIVDQILDFARLWNPDSLGFEDGQIWKALESQFRRRCQERNYYPAFEILVPLSDKMTRASPLRGRMQFGKIFFDKEMAGYDEMEREILRFPAGRHDDIVDALAWAVRLTLNHSAPTESAKPRLDRRGRRSRTLKDRLRDALKGFGETSHMAA